MSYWMTDPELFLYAKGTDDVHLWRCKKSSVISSTSSSSVLVVPMKPTDFDCIKNVKNHLELLGYLFEWDETNYKQLVKYIYERRLLVNIQGLVIVEIHKAVVHVKHESKMIDDDKGVVHVKHESKMIDDAIELPIYIRSLDVLYLKRYLPKLRERPIPVRKVQYLEDMDGRAALTEDEEEGDSTVAKLTARVAALEAENDRLKSKNNYTLDDINVTKLIATFADLEAQNTRLESKNDTLDVNVTRLTAELAARTDKVVDLESKNNTLEGKVTRLTTDLATRTDKIAALESKNITLEGKVTKLTADLATRTNELATSQQELNLVKNAHKEVWMNDLTNSEWVGSEGVRKLNPVDQNLIFVGRQGSYTIDDNNTNVRARYMYTVKRYPDGYDYKAVSLEDLIPNKEKARFSKYWYYCRSQGKIYMIL